MALQADLRAGYARLLNAESDDVAVTTGTSFGLGCVLAGMDLGPGDEIVTSDHEHPGLLGPLIAARHRGATVRRGPVRGARRTRSARPRRSSPPRT